MLPQMVKVNEILISKQLGMQKGDELLIPSAEKFLDVAKSAQAYATSIGVKSTIVIPPPLPRGEYSKAVQGMANEADGVYILGMGFNTKEALDHGTRLLGVILRADTLVRCLVQVDILKLKEKCWMIRDAISDADTLRITCRNGTDFTEDLSGKIGSPGGMWAGDPWEELYEFSPLGYPGYARYPPLDRCDGKLVFDFWPRLGILSEPITWTIEKDEIVNVEGGWEAKRFWDYIKDWPEKNLAEMQIGMNRGARIHNWDGPEWERYRGAVHFGMGSKMPYPAFGENGKVLNPEWKAAKHHTDAMILAPTITVDDKVLVKDGIVQPPYA